MRILTVVFNLEKGGTQRAAQNFAEAYLADGHDSRVLTLKTGGVREDELRERGVPLWTSLDGQTIREIAAWYPDILHLHSHGLCDADVRSLLAAVPAARVVETNVFSRPSPWVDRVDVSFQLSPWCEWLYILRGGPPSRTAIVSNPIRTHGFRRASADSVTGFRLEHAIAPAEILLGRVGQAYDRKWSPLLIDAFEHVRSLGVAAKLLVVNAPASILDRARRSDWAADIRVVDQILGDEPMSVAYSAMDVFVHVADQGESFGIVLTEAMLCETPCVTFSTPWEDNSQPGVVGNMQGGLVATTRRGFYDALTRLCHDESLRRQLGARGRAKVLKEYDSLVLARAALRHASAPDGGGTRTSRKDILAIYTDAVDCPSWLTLLSIGRFSRLKLSKYTTGYQSWGDFTRWCFATVIRKARRAVGLRSVVGEACR